MKAGLQQSCSLTTLIRRAALAGVLGPCVWAMSVAYAETPPADGPGREVVNAADSSSINIDLSQRDAPELGFLNIAPARAASGAMQGPKRYGFVLTANGDAVGVPMDLSVSQHVTLNSGNYGEGAHSGRGAEVRLGGAIADLRGAEPQADGTNWYVFAASDDEAVTWRPGEQRGYGASGASLALQDRVEIGDMQAGVTLETRGVQASLAYVEREVSARIGARSVSQDENFAGLTLTMRR